MIDFNNTEIAFKSKNNRELKNSYFLFKAIGYNFLVKLGPPIIEWCFKLRLPVKGLIKATVFKQFCGGEDIEGCENAIDKMHTFHIGTILDYSVEGEENEHTFDATAQEIIKTVEKAANNPKIPFSVFKVTGIARFGLLEAINNKKTLGADENSAYERVCKRVDQICATAARLNVRIFIDAEESWIQDTIDALALDMIKKYNKEKAIVYNTLQFYRHDRLAFLKLEIEKAKQENYIYGIKLVRGAYMEKEADRASKMGYLNPIQATKLNSDNDYNKALAFCVEHLNYTAICAGTHNEESCLKLVDLMQKNAIAKNDERIYFSQLFGMSDHLSYNLANAGYNVAKYLPYGPVKSVLPYLFRRAQENTSVKGQAGRELALIQKEIARRK